MSITNTATPFLPHCPGPLPIVEPQASPTVVATTPAALEFARLEAWLASSHTLQLPLHQIESQQQTKGREVQRLLLQAHLQLRGDGDVGPAPISPAFLSPSAAWRKFCGMRLWTLTPFIRNAPPNRRTAPSSWRRSMVRAFLWSSPEAHKPPCDSPRDRKPTGREWPLWPRCSPVRPGYAPQNKSW